MLDKASKHAAYTDVYIFRAMIASQASLPTMLHDTSLIFRLPSHDIIIYYYAISIIKNALVITFTAASRHAQKMRVDDQDSSPSLHARHHYSLGHDADAQRDMINALGILMSPSRAR